jgi:hypothetical protein
MGTGIARDMWSGYPEPQDEMSETLLKIWYQEYQARINGTPAISTPLSVTPIQTSVGASASGTIPIGAKGWTFTVLSGTATFGGVPVSAGFSDSDPNILLAAISYSTGSASSAYVRYNS